MTWNFRKKAGKKVQFHQRLGSNQILLEIEV